MKQTKHTAGPMALHKRFELVKLLQAGKQRQTNREKQHQGNAMLDGDHLKRTQPLGANLQQTDRQDGGTVVVSCACQQARQVPGVILYTRKAGKQCAATRKLLGPGTLAFSSTRPTCQQTAVQGETRSLVVRYVRTGDWRKPRTRKK